MDDIKERGGPLMKVFPPVPTTAWEEAITGDLKGADYEKRLVWKTDEGIAVRPYYRAEDAQAAAPIARQGSSWEMVRAGNEPKFDVSVIEQHESGATAVQEVALALSAGADVLAVGGTVKTVAFSTGSNHFMEIAKLRAFRLLWPAVARAFNPSDTGAVRIHACTAGENKTLYDPHVNMLRVVTEALSAVIGGCDSLTITACRFDAHLADNVHHILREESHIDAVADPAAGSYYVEALTDKVAREAWALFQSIEAPGGFAKFAASGALETFLSKGREAKEKAVASRRRVLVGTNNYPNLGERQLDAADGMPDSWRLAEAFERIRLRTERHAKKVGRTPRVLLLERGDLKMRKARVSFCLNFFGCGGFEVVVSPDLSEADLVVLCSSDPEYLSLASEICPQVSVPVVVAGYPKDQVETLKGVGVADFVHVLSNAVETLTAWQNRLGIEDKR
jgi:methylmalonyl-CoA mutase